MLLFRIFLLIDAAVALVALYFFAIGLDDGSVGSYNILFWTALLCGIAGIIGGGLPVASAGRPLLASGVLAILAVPALVLALFLLVVVILQPNWR
jgi:hypothetical protein